MSGISVRNKFAIVLFNLGGPDSLTSVRRFLFNLFYDRSIINLPNPLRFIIAMIISINRTNTAKEIYEKVGNKSPILKETEDQKQALENDLKNRSNEDFKIFICMRHFHPQSKFVVNQISDYDPSNIILLPLYPQFSTTTTGSSINDFTSSLKKYDKSFDKRKVKAICCYPTNDDFIKSHVSLIEQALEKLVNKDNFRILFSAHGLPIKIIKSGDPYQSQVEKTVSCIVDRMKIDNLDYRITYQSRVGPVEWLKPDTKDEIESGSVEGKALIVVPIAFVSEHVETLVELDIEYKNIADKYGVEYVRVPTLRTNEYFINNLSQIVLDSMNVEQNSLYSVESGIKEKICGGNFISCIHEKCELTK